MRCIEIQSPLNEISGRGGISVFFPEHLIDLRSRIRILGSEGVYLDENCGTNPSRHLPGPNKNSKKIKNTDFRGLGGFGHIK